MISVLTPQDGEIVELLTTAQKEYIKHPYFAWTDKTVENEFWTRNKMINGIRKDQPVYLDRSFPNPVHVSFYPKTDGIIVLSDKKGTIQRIMAKEGSAEIYNLVSGEEYAFFVETGKERSDSVAFKTDSTLPRLIKIDGISNVRDIGGYHTRSRLYVKYGLIYRSSEFDRCFKITEKGMASLRLLGIKTNFDIQREEESSGSVLSDCGIRFFHLPIEPYITIFDKEMMIQYGHAFQAILEPDFMPCIIHCFGGMDRTGTFILILLGVLGVNEEDALIDYELSSFSVFASRSRESAYFREFYKELLTFGNGFNDSCEKYLLSCGLSTDDMQKIRDQLLCVN